MTGSPLACDPGGIPAEERAEHCTRSERLFAAALERWELPDGIAVRLPPDLFGEIARFVDNERRCCPEGAGLPAGLAGGGWSAEGPATAGDRVGVAGRAHTDEPRGIGPLDARQGDPPRRLRRFQGTASPSLIELLETALDEAAWDQIAS